VRVVLRQPARRADGERNPQRLHVLGRLREQNHARSADRHAGGQHGDVLE
jgi:hypothetical protein